MENPVLERKADKGKRETAEEGRREMKKIKLVGLIGGLFITLLVFPSTVLSHTIYVPGDYATIREAINAAGDGDTVLVADGTYTATEGDVNLSWDGNLKHITVRSENGPDNCIIDCLYQREPVGRGSSAFYFDNTNQDNTDIIDGFTIQNAVPDSYADGGSGIWCSSSSPTITNCIFIECGGCIFRSGGQTGGGIFCKNSSNPIITNCTFIKRGTEGYWGAGIGCIESSSPVITNCTIRDSEGSGIFCSNSSPTITHCTITENKYSGVYFNETPSSAIIDNCIIAGNSAEYGCGIHCESSSPAITNCTIIANKRELYYSDGGGIYCSNYSSPTITNCIITRNIADSRGGGIHCRYYSSPTITNCTITENEAHEGGGIWCYAWASPIIINSILWNNSAEWGPEIALCSTYGGEKPSELTVSYSDVEGGEADAYVEEGCTLNWGNGNIDDDPLFVNAGGRDFHLQDVSPCIGTGEGGVDMGAYEAAIYNNPPYKPSNLSPSDNATDVSLTPVLSASDFSDPERDAHSLSHWQITDTSGDYSSPLWDWTSDVDLTSATVQGGALSYSTIYYWRVRYKDNYAFGSVWSEWSDETSFTTGSAPSGGGGGGGCFIATAAFGTPMASEVRVLSKFRDEYLLTNPVGRIFVKVYYKTSPPIADFIRNKPLLRRIVRGGLKPLIWVSKMLPHNI